MMIPSISPERREAAHNLLLLGQSLRESYTLGPDIFVKGFLLLETRLESLAEVIMDLCGIPAADAKCSKRHPKGFVTSKSRYNHSYLERVLLNAFFYDPMYYRHIIEDLCNLGMEQRREGYQDPLGMDKSNLNGEG